MPYVSCPSATAWCTCVQVTSDGSQPSRFTTDGLTPRATGDVISGVSEVIRFAASGWSRR